MSSSYAVIDRLCRHTQAFFVLGAFRFMQLATSVIAHAAVSVLVCWLFSAPACPAAPACPTCPSCPGAAATPATPGPASDSGLGFGWTVLLCLNTLCVAPIIWSVVRRLVPHHVATEQSALPAEAGSQRMGVRVVPRRALMAPTPSAGRGRHIQLSDSE